MRVTRQRGMELLDIHCATCGAPAAYDIVRHTYACAYCGNEVSVGAAIAERKGFRALRRERAGQAAGNLEAQQCTCTGCGATVVIPEGEALQSCSFCGRALVRGSYAKSAAFPEFIIPFRLTLDEARERLEAWCAANAFRPEARHVRPCLDDLQGYYLPYRLVRGPVDCAVTRAGATRTYDCGGFLAGSFVNTTSQLDNLTLNGMEPFDLRELEEFEYGYLARQKAKLDDLGANQLDARVKEEVAAEYGPVVARALETRNMSVEPDTGELMVMPVLLPVYFVSRGNVLAVVNGQTGKVAVRGERVRKTLPWWLRPIAATLAVFLVALAIATHVLGNVEGGLVMSGAITLVMGLIFYTAFSNAHEGEARKTLDPKVFSSRAAFERGPDGKLRATAEPIGQKPVRPVFFEDVDGARAPVQIRFTTPARVAKMAALGLLVLFLPLVIAFVLNGFDYHGLHPEGAAVWLCIFVPVVPAYYVKLGRIDIYENPYVYVLDGRGKRRRVKTKSRTTTVLDVVKQLFRPSLLVAGLTLAVFLLVDIYLVLGG